MGANGQCSRCITVERKGSCQDQCCQLFSERCVVEKLSSGYKVSVARAQLLLITGLEYKHHQLYRLCISCMVLKQLLIYPRGLTREYP